MAQILRSQLEKSLVPRADVDFLQLFNFVYSDGTQMLTLGGLIEEPSKDATLKKGGIYNLRFVRASSDPLKISVPPLTMREKLWIDQNLKHDLRAAELEFELNEQLLENYKEYYRHYPQYHEAVI